MVAVWRCGHLKSPCTREFSSAQCSVDAIDSYDAHWIRIEFALGSSVMNRFESGFSVNRPLM